MLSSTRVFTLLVFILIISVHACLIPSLINFERRGAAIRLRA